MRNEIHPKKKNRYEITADESNRFARSRADGLCILFDAWMEAILIVDIIIADVNDEIHI